MSMYLGNIGIERLYIGDIEVSKLYLGTNLIYDKQHKKPIILLDDVFSELDPTRRRCLIKNFRNHQVIITSVEDFHDN